MHYYTFNVGDYRRDTAHLSRVEHGIYRDLIDWYYLEEKPIPTETDSVSRRLRLDSDADKVALKNVLADFFTLESDGYHHSRIDRDIEHYHSNAIKNRENGKKGGRPKTEKTQSVTSGLPVESESKAKQTLTNNQEPITINQEPTKDNTPRKRVDLVCPDSVDQQVWVDFVQHRKSKRSALTQTALEGIQREAAKAGWTLEQALRETVARGWTGFKADWVKVEHKGESFRERDSRLAIERVKAFAPGAAAKPKNTGLVIDVEPLFGRIEK